MAVQNGNRALAAREYVAALDYADDPALARRATRIALFAGKPALAYRGAAAWARAAPKNLDAQKTAARLALRQGDGDGLSRYAAQILGQASGGPKAGFAVLADVLSGEPGSADLALKTQAKLAAQHPDLAEGYYSQALLAYRYKHYAQADRAIQGALARRPQWADAVLLRAAILVARKQVLAADKLVASLGGSAKQRADHEQAYARLLLDANENDAAARAFEQVLKLQPGRSDARYALGVLSLARNDSARAHKAFATLYRNGHHRDNAAYYLGRIAAEGGDYAAARRWYGRVSGGAHAFEARVHAASSYYRQGDDAAARAAFQRLRAAHPELRARLYAVQGEMLYEANHSDKALALYNHALAQDPQDADLLYGRSLVYERMGHVKKAEADLRSILARDPNDARSLNALGYMLSNHSQRYQEALGYISEALAADPGDPAVQDSMGWVQYRLGHLDKARKYLRRAYDASGNPEIAAHLGEVLWTLGEHDKARAVWQQAKKKEPDNAVLRETIKRLTQ